MVTLSREEAKKIKEDIALSLNIVNPIIEAMPHPAMLINSGRKILAANEFAKEAGAVIGAYCWKEFGKSSFLSDKHLKLSMVDPDAPGIKCTFCRATESLNRQSKENIPDFQLLGRQFDTYWVAINKDMYLHYAIDVTDHAKAIDDLKEGDERFSFAMEATEMGLWDWNIQNQKAYLNSTYYTMFGYIPNEFPPSYECFIERVHTEDQAVLKQAIQDYLSGVKPKYSEEFRFHRKDRSIAWVLARGKVVDYDANGKPVRFIGTVTDITERKQAEAEHLELQNRLVQIQRMESIGRLAGGVAHDYNNMLSVIIGYTEIAQIKSGQDDPLQLQDDLDQVLTAAKRSRDITRQLLAFARKQTIDPKVLNLNEAVTGTFKMLRQLLGENIELAWLPKKDLWPVEIDPTQLDQILTNLCINARDAITDNGRITIKTDMATLDQAFCSNHLGSVPGDFVKLTVSDDGCGMSEEIRDKIFEPFFTTKEVGCGTGLGLPMVYGVVKQSNGFINCLSEPERGATFEIYLPRYTEMTTVNQQIDDEKVIKGQGETILLVEDEPAMLKLTEKILQELGYKVLPALTPSEALSLVEAHSGTIDLLITDVVMPGMNGRELADRLRLIYPQLQCLYMSGYTADVIAHHGVLDKNILFIQKPFARGEFSAHVKSALKASYFCR